MPAAPARPVPAEESANTPNGSLRSTRFYQGGFFESPLPS